MFAGGTNRTNYIPIKILLSDEREARMVGIGSVHDFIISVLISTVE